MLPVRCSAACDVRAQVAGSFEITGELSLAAAGRGQIGIRPDLEPIAPLRAAPVRILVRYGAPGARRASARTLSPTLRRLPTPPAPRVRGLTARRDGNAVVVRWRTAAPADPDRFIVAGRDGEDGAVRFVDEVEGRRGRTFQIRLPDRARKIVRGHRAHRRRVPLDPARVHHPRARMSLAVAGAMLALAAPFGELPFQEVRGGAACLSPTGTPGELARWTPDGAELLAAGPGGLVATARVQLGKIGSCPLVATAGAAGVAAGVARDGIRVALRQPGGGWGPVLRIPEEYVAAVDVAVSPRGDAIIAWADYSLDEKSGLQVRRAAPGGAFGSPEPIGGPDEGLPEVSVGMAADGETVLAFTVDRSDAGEVRTTIMRPGTPIPAARTVGDSEGFGGEVALAVAPDGRSLLAVDESEGLTVYERSPGGGFLAAATVEGEFPREAPRSACGPTAVRSWRCRAGSEATCRC